MLKGKHIKLRVIEKRDLELMRSWRCSFEVYQYFSGKEQLSQEEQEKWYQAICCSNSCKYFIVEDEKDSPIGVCNLSSINWIHRTANIGIYFPATPTSPIIPVEAIMVLIDYAFDTLNIRKINSEVLATNHRALEFNKGLGFVQEGIEREQLFHFGNHVDQVLMGLFKHEYLEATKKLRSKLIP